MIDRLLYVVTAVALLIVLMFDQTFAENLSRAFETLAIPALNPWELGVAGILAGLIVAAIFRERRG
jgi:hypothetical protein